MSTPTGTLPAVLVSEVFGPTFQGEGPATGRRASFIRLGACNLSCSWCDTPYSWDGKRYNLREQLGRRSVADVVAEVAAHDTGLCVITGGEPLLQQSRGLVPLVRLLVGAGFDVHVETNGTLRPAAGLADLVALWVVSPKLANSHQPPGRAIVPDALTQFALLARNGSAILKVVCEQPPDVALAAALADAYGFPRATTWILPEGTTPALILARQRALTPPTLALGLNMTTRLHVLIWGAERGH